MSAARKFTFDLDLAAVPVRNKVMAEGELEHLLAAARQEGYEEGLKKGKASTEARATEALAAAAEALAQKAAAMVQTLDAHQKETLREAVRLAASVGRKLAAHLIARQPETELEALIADCMVSLERAPHLVIRCPPDLCDPMQKAAEARMKITGFTGRLVVLGDPDIGLGDGRLEWADGGLVRDINAISDDINARIAAYLSARGTIEKE